MGQVPRLALKNRLARTATKVMTPGAQGASEIENSKARRRHCTRGRVERRRGVTPSESLAVARAHARGALGRWKYCRHAVLTDIVAHPIVGRREAPAARVQLDVTDVLLAEGAIILAIPAVVGGPADVPATRVAGNSLPGLDLRVGMRRRDCGRLHGEGGLAGGSSK